MCRFCRGASSWAGGGGAARESDGQLQAILEHRASTVLAFPPFPCPWNAARNGLRLTKNPLAAGRGDAVQAARDVVRGLLPGRRRPADRQGAATLRRSAPVSSSVGTHTPVHNTGTHSCTITRSDATPPLQCDAAEPPETRRTVGRPGSTSNRMPSACQPSLPSQTPSRPTPSAGRGPATAATPAAACRSGTTPSSTRCFCAAGWRRTGRRSSG